MLWAQIFRPTLELVQLAGIDIRDADALNLAMLLRHKGHTDSADHIETACISYERQVALTIEDRDAIIAVLDDPPDGLATLQGTLQGTLLLQLEWRRSHGLE